jgi:hypothetical protein
MPLTRAPEAWPRVFPEEILPERKKELKVSYKLKEIRGTRRKVRP